MSKLQIKTQNYLILSVLFLLPAYLIKIKFGWVSFNVLELLIAILFLVWIFRKEKKCLILYTKYFLPILLIFAGFALSVIASKNFYVGLGAIKGWFVFPIVFAVIFFDALKKDESLLRRSLRALFFSGVTVSAAGVVYKFLGILTYDGRLKIFWDSPNQLAMFLAVPFLIGMFFARQETEVKKKRLYVSGLALIGLSLFYTFSYGAWLALAVALFVVFWLEYGKIKQKKYIAIFLLVLLIFIGLASLSKYKNIQNMGERSSLASRFSIWKSAGLMIENNPLFGIGPGNFQEKYLEYQKYFPPYLEWSAHQPHNIFLAFWLESGLIGLAGFIILLFYFFRDNKKVYPFTKINEANNTSITTIKKQAGNHPVCKESFGGGAIANNHEVSILLLATMIYILVHGLVDTTYWRNDLAVVFWAVVAANCYLAKRDS